MCGPLPLFPPRRLPASQLLQSFEGWLRTASSRPFFGYLALWEPHEPVQRWSPRTFQRWYSGPPRLPAVEGGGEGGGEGEGSVEGESEGESRGEGEGEGGGEGEDEAGAEGEGEGGG